jgi:small-conductance mechanosensitive channel
MSLPRLISLALSLSLLLGAAACDSGADPIKPPDLVASDKPAKDAPDKAPEAAATKPQGKASAADDKPSGIANALLSEVSSDEQSIGSPGAAWRALKRSFAGFLHRDPLGFNLDLPSHVGADLLALVEDVRLALLSPPSALALFGLITPVVLLLLVLMILSAMDHYAARIVHDWQARVHIPSAGRWASDCMRALILLLGQITPPALLSALCFLTFNAMYGKALWVSALSEIFILLLGFRAAHTMVEIAFALDPLGVPDDHARVLRRFANATLLLLVTTFTAIQLVESFAWRPEVRALFMFALRASVAALPIYLLSRKSSVMALLPVRSASRSYMAMRRAADQNYNALLALTIALLGLRAMGYGYAATFILVRGYGLFLMLLLTFAAGARLRKAIDLRIEALGKDDPQLDSLHSIRRLATLGLIFLTADVALQLLGVYDALMILLRTPILRIQQITFSAHNALSAVIVVSAAVLLSQILRYLLNARVFPALQVEVGVAYAINTLISYAVLVVGFFLVLVALGVNLSALTVVLASLSVGIGFGLQTMTENLIAGFIILFGRAVRKGDYVTIEDTFGRVEAVGARSVILRTPDNVDLLVPTKALVGTTITNWTYRDSLVRLHIPVSVTYSAKPRVVEEVLLKAALRHESVLDTPAPEVWFVSFGDSAIDFELLVYFDCRKITQRRLTGQLYFHIWDALEEAKIEIPFPQRDLHVRSAPGLEHILRQPYTDKGESAPDGQA